GLALSSDFHPPRRRSPSSLTVVHHRRSLSSFTIFTRRRTRPSPSSSRPQDRQHASRLSFGSPSTKTESLTGPRLHPFIRPSSSPIPLAVVVAVVVYHHLHSPSSIVLPRHRPSSSPLAVIFHHHRSSSSSLPSVQVQDPTVKTSTFKTSVGNCSRFKTLQVQDLSGILFNIIVAYRRCSPSSPVIGVIQRRPSSSSHVAVSHRRRSPPLLLVIFSHHRSRSPSRHRLKLKTSGGECSRPQAPQVQDLRGILLKNWLKTTGPQDPRPQWDTAQAPAQDCSRPQWDTT
ncbi:hypothetical protein B0H19DRAFT_1237966, partial [Mycena capillaripes]